MKFGRLMNKYTILTACFFGCFFFVSCRITYTVRNQYQELEQFLHFPCGKVGFELEGQGDSKFIFRQTFNLDAPVISFPDSVRIFFNEIPITYTIKNKGNKQMEISQFAQSKRVEMLFETTRGVFDGDRIFIFAPNYLKCNDQLVGFDTISYTFTNRLRIYGVNAL